LRQLVGEGALPVEKDSQGRYLFAPDDLAPLRMEPPRATCAPEQESARRLASPQTAEPRASGEQGDGATAAGWRRKRSEYTPGLPPARP
jgi:hypothetical protein